MPFEIELFDSKIIDDKTRRNKIPFWNTNQIVKQSPWRLCPIGKSWVTRHPKHLKSGTITDHDGHCRLNHKGHDILHADEIRRIPTLEIFKNSSVKASTDKLVFGEDAKDPSVAIAASIRWLFRKYRLAKGKKNATWMDALEQYKGISKQKGLDSDKIRNDLNKFFNNLTKNSK